MEIKIKPGDILVSQWGYARIKVKWYLVVKTTPKMAVLQEIAGDKKYTGCSFARGKSTPDKSKKIGEQFRRRVIGGDAVMIDEHSLAELWDGSPKDFID